MRRKQIYWVIQIAGWTLHGLLLTIYLLLQESKLLESFLLSLCITFWYLLSTHLFRNFIKQHKWIDIKPWKLSIFVLLSTFLLALSNYMFQIVTLTFLSLIHIPEDFEVYTIFLYVIYSMSIYLFWSLLYFIIHYIDRYQKSLKYEAALSEFELNRLKSQLNPHFIFNALNSIRALVEEDPDKSKTAITQLSDMLRSSLAMDKHKLISVREEIETIRDYLSLESIRFEERLKTEIEVSQDCYDFYIPPMMVQTLIENGIKHGISQLTTGGTISLNMFVEDEKMHIIITNDGTYEPSDSKRKGFGIYNTKQRLKLLFGDDTTFEIANADNNKVVTKVIIPSVDHAHVMVY